MLKNVLRVLFLQICLLLTGPMLSAKHIVGGELFYECLGFTNDDPNSGSRRYQIYMRLYRDALGGGADFDSAPGTTLAASVSIYLGSDGNLIPTQFLSAPLRSSVDPNPGNACVKVPPTVEIEEGLYTFQVIDLPISNESYYIVYQRCCRNEALTNINDPAISGATYFIEITPEAQQICNNSPAFRDFPPFLICAGESFRFDHSADDADGHRLEYSFCSPFLGGGPDNNNPNTAMGIAPDPDAPPPYEEVGFIQPTYSAQEPLGAASNFMINPSTGLITGVPMIEGQFVVGVCVREFDSNNNLLSEVRRDFQFLVTSCEKNIEVVIESDSVNASGAFVINSCSSGAVQIQNSSTQSDDVQDFYWEFEQNGTLERYNDFSPSITFGNPGIYNGRFIISATTGCIDTGEVSVVILEGTQADFSLASDPCEEEVVRFQNNSIAPPGADVVWQWDLGDGVGTSSDFEPVYQYMDAGTRSVQLLAITDQLCRDSQSIEVDFFPLPSNLSVEAISGQGCLPQDARFGLNYARLDNSYSILWDFGDGNSSTEVNPIHVYNQAGVFTPSVMVSAPNGCTFDSLLASINVEDAPVANFRFTPNEPTSLEPTVQFNDLSERADSWLWQFANLGSATDQSPSFTFPDSAGTYPVQLIVSHPNGCTDTLVQEVILRAITDFYVPNAFSPNQDGVNDDFRGFGPLGGKTDFEMAVFSRWGDRLFFSRDPNQGWNGQRNNTGENLPQGVYVYYVTFKDDNGDLITLKGLVNLLR